VSQTKENSAISAEPVKNMDSRNEVG